MVYVAAPGQGAHPRRGWGWGLYPRRSLVRFNTVSAVGGNETFFAVDDALPVSADAVLGKVDTVRSFFLFGVNGMEFLVPVKAREFSFSGHRASPFWGRLSAKVLPG